MLPTIVVGVSSSLGGFVSASVSAIYLKITFAVFLLISAFLLFLNKTKEVKLDKFGVMA